MKPRWRDAIPTIVTRIALVVSVSIPVSAARAANTPSKFAKEHLAAASVLNAGPLDKATFFVQLLGTYDESVTITVE